MLYKYRLLDLQTTAWDWRSSERVVLAQGQREG